MKSEAKIEIELSPEALAKEFINWGDAEQAEFINLIGKAFKEADFDAELQCCFMSDNITKLGKDFIYTMANFIKVQKLIPETPHYNTAINTFDHDSLR